MAAGAYLIDAQYPGDANNDPSTSASITLVVKTPITINPATLPVPAVGVAYSTTFTASGGTGSSTFSTTGAIPAGMSLSANGVLSGTPTQAGPNNFTIKATDASGWSGEQGYTLVVNSTLTITTASLPQARVADTYTQSLSASGGIAPYSYTITSGSLPAGLGLAADGTISGTPTQAGAFNVNVMVTDSVGQQASASAQLSLAVQAPSLAITPPTLPAPVLGSAYSQTVVASGGTAPYSYAITSGAFPAGLSLNPTTGEISGTAIEAGGFSFTVAARDSSTGVGAPFMASQGYTFTITAPTISLTPNRLLDPAVGVPYAQKVTASGGSGSYTYSVFGAWPGGLTLSPDGNITGTPTQAGMFRFTITATDRSGGFSGGQMYEITIGSPTITVAGNPSDATGGVPYTGKVTASGGTGPYRFEILTGALPSGLTLDPGGTISGTPSVSGSFDFTVKATDDSTGTGAPFFGTKQMTLKVAAPGIAIGPSSLPNATGGVVYSQALDASGGVGPYSFSVLSGAMPAGINLSTKGVVSGTPTVSGSFDLTVRAADKFGFTGDQKYTLVVAAPEIRLTPASLPAGVGGDAYAQVLNATGGTGPYSFAVSDGALPSGLTLNTDGTLSGTPAQAGSFAVTVTATDAHGFAGTQAYALAISAPLPVAKNISVDVLAGTSARINLTAGATGGPFTTASVVSPPAAEHGRASIEGNGGNYELVFASAATASGKVAISYTVSNKWGASAPATITFNVAARPDPARDPEVTGLIAAQIESANRFAAAQIRNFNGRLEQLHSESERQAGSVNIQLGLSEKTNARKPLSYAEDERGTARSGTTLGFPMDRLSGEPAANAAPKAMAFWAGGFVNFGQRDNGGIDIKNTLAGVSGGVDYRFSPRFVGGIGFGYGRDIADIGENGTRSQAQAISIAAYGSYNPVANVFVDGLLGYSRLDFDSRRFVTNGGGFAEGGRDGQQLFGSLTTAYEHRQDGRLLSPYGRLEASWSRLDAYTETGAGPYNLTYGAQSLSTVAGVLGLRAEYAMPMAWGVFTPKARLEYTHDFSGSSRASMGYADLGNGLPYGFDVKAESRDYLGLGLGFEASIANGWLFGFDYSTARGTGGNAQDHTMAVKIGARW
ncbi:hypothetical protein QV13_22365 [Mesorhizobium hungaricum]|jgi:large repetitive protein|uniref:Autotransporter domain-containing protein n=3 Tax=Hyphomicrobiales TaxID=356 RepID=A0A1C2DC94_9HYPH|nr:uncharacterized protein YhjY with autotransporter beta-barrel domain [Mesorhizobium sp. YL-MeA3-2017]OCX12388.1 hypothetical protein QV13_22365 [Mesorhizobium hungaricum]